MVAGTLFVLPFVVHCNGGKQVRPAIFVFPSLIIPVHFPLLSFVSFSCCTNIETCQPLSIADPLTFIFPTISKQPCPFFQLPTTKAYPKPSPKATTTAMVPSTIHFSSVVARQRWRHCSRTLSTWVKSAEAHHTTLSNCS